MVKRHRERGRYDTGLINEILDEGLICHLGFVHDGHPYVIPTIHARSDDTLYIHGSPASRMLRNLSSGTDACVTVTLVDGLVLARSAFHHSMNYRSAVLLGTLREVTDRDEKMTAAEAITEHVARGRWEHVRWPNDEEMRKTLIVAMPIDEASAKVRTGPPVDDDEDMTMDTWAGVLPLHVTSGEAEPDPQLSAHISVPEHVTDWQPNGGGER
jgi:nitroimidazol reductase NimA-like FMN-containing flavoprotein (pyridoxamine 5'-phosphate oxidase superfamily)